MPEREEPYHAGPVQETTRPVGSGSIILTASAEALALVVADVSGEAGLALTEGDAAWLRDRLTIWLETGRLE